MQIVRWSSHNHHFCQLRYHWTASPKSFKNTNRAKNRSVCM